MNSGNIHVFVVYITLDSSHVLLGRYKTWTLDSGLDYRLDYGPNSGLDFRLESRSYELTLSFQIFPSSITYSLVLKVVIIQVLMDFFSLYVSV